MTGGGFGGWVVSLVARTSVERFIDIVQLRYNEIAEFEAKCYSTSAQDGVTVHELKMDTSY